MTEEIQKNKAALLSICSNSLLIITKFIVGLFSGSISIISEAVHSCSDLLASIIAFFSIKKASQPADKEHPYGHGKFEDLSGVIEGMLIVFASFYIVFESLAKIKSGAAHSIDTSWGIAVMLLSVFVNIAVSTHLFKVAKKTDSLALLADAEHLRTDVYSSFGVFLGLLAIKLTGLVIIDAIIAILVAVLIFKTGLELSIVAVNNLLDISLPDEEINLIKELLKKYHSDDLVDIQIIKTRKSGKYKIIELTLVVREDITIKNGHILCDKIEKNLEDNIRNTNVFIHLEPCRGVCSNCPKDCK